MKVGVGKFRVIRELKRWSVIYGNKVSISNFTIFTLQKKLSKNIFHNLLSKTIIVSSTLYTDEYTIYHHVSKSKDS
ncbi:MAG: hypothetical protein LBM96_03125 [Methanobrevibacter sp.]|nr:hypothetical protein [Candidatus Methanoflexus mossambicus]